MRLEGHIYIFRGEFCTEFPRSSAAIFLSWGTGSFWCGPYSHDPAAGGIISWNAYPRYPCKSPPRV